MRDKYGERIVQKYLKKLRTQPAVKQEKPSFMSRGRTLSPNGLNLPPQRTLTITANVDHLRINNLTLESLL